MFSLVALPTRKCDYLCSACDNFKAAVVNSEHHLCQVPVGSTGCSTIMCTSSVTLDSQAVVINTAVSFDPCTMSVYVKAGGADITIPVTGTQECLSYSQCIGHDYYA